MKQTKKFSYHVIQNGDSWSVEIVRRVSTKKTRVSKRQDGFASEAEANAWGEAQVAAFIKDLNLKEQKKRRARNNEPDEDLF